jgi:hypothetical protein
MAEALEEAGVAGGDVDEAVRVLYYYIAGTLMLSNALGDSRQKRARHFERGLDVILAGFVAELVRQPLDGGRLVHASAVEGYGRSPRAVRPVGAPQ